MRSDVLKMITDYNFNEIDSPDTKVIIGSMDEMHFDIQFRAESLRERTLLKNFYNKRAIFASGLRTLFHSENPNETCDKLQVLLQEKQAGNNSVIINEEMVAIIDKLLEYKCITSTQHIKIPKNFNVI